MERRTRLIGLAVGAIAGAFSYYAMGDARTQIAFGTMCLFVLFFDLEQRLETLSARLDQLEQRIG